MSETDFRDRILADLRRMEGKIDKQSDTLAAFGERVAKVEVRAGLVAVVATAVVLILKEVFK